MEQIKKTEKRDKVLSMLCIACISFCYVSFSLIFRYEDTVSFTAWSVEFWDCLFYEDGIGNFYAYTIQNLRGAMHGVPQGSWLTFFPWIIWNFPLFLTHMNPRSIVINQACILWSKGLLLISTIFLAVFVYKIVYRLTGRNTKISMYSALLMCGSLELLDSVAYTGQDEIIYLTLLVMAVYYSMINKRVLAFALAIMVVTICPLMIIPVAFLFLVYEENVIVSFFKSIICLVPTVLFEFFYKYDVVYASVKDINTVGTFQLMMNTSTFSSSMGTVCTAAMGIVILAFWVAFVKTDEDRDRRVIATLAIVFFGMCFLMGSTFYRSWMYVPFIVMFACIEIEWISYKMFLILVCSLSRFMCFFTNEYNLNTKYLIGAIRDRFDNLPEQVINPTSAGYDCALYVFKVSAFASILLIFMLHYFRNKLAMKKFISEKIVIVIQSFLGIVLMAYFAMKMFF